MATNFGWTKREKKLVLIFLCSIFLLTSLYLYDRYAHKNAKSSVSAAPIKKEELVLSPSEKPVVEETNHVVWADIKGAVAHPGVYSLKTGQRVDALVRASGGLLPEANDQVINLAKVVKDGEMVYVPRKGEQNPIPVSAPGMSQQGSAKVVHINSATAEELSSLTGIGEAKARAILEYRTAHGSFGDKEELKKVNGIGEKLYERIKESISAD